LTKGAVDWRVAAHDAEDAGMALTEVGEGGEHQVGVIGLVAVPDAPPKARPIALRVSS
jgi:hypothetical protein